MKCPKCKTEIDIKYIAGYLGSIKSEKKAKASRLNGKKRKKLSTKI